MADFNNVLIICRDLKSVRRVSRFKPQAQSRYILASDDPRVHEAAKKYPWIDEICWIEQMESFYNIADDVIRLTETVNEWLKALADDKRGFPEELLFFTRIVEGGMTTQRIQDVLLLVRSYFELLTTHNVDEVIVLPSRLAIWEDEVLVNTVKTKGVRVQRIRNIDVMTLANKVKSVLRPLTYEPYFLLNYLKIRCHSFSKKNCSFQKNEILFQLSSSSLKHIENITYLMESLKKRSYCPTALCWGTARGAEEVRKQGLRANELENLLSLSDWMQSLKRLILTTISFRGRKHQFISHPMLVYLSVPLGSLLWHSVYHLLFAEIAKRYRLMAAAKAYFMKNRPLAVKLWGRTFMPEGKIVWNCINGSQKPMLFHYSLGVELEEPYAPANEDGDLWLATGKLQKDVFVNSLGILPDKVVVVGQSRYAHLRKFKKNVTRSMSFSELNISPDYSFYVLYDYPGFLRGFHSKQEILLVVMELIDLANANKNTAIIIKPHPGAKTEMLNDMLYKHHLPNIFVLNRKILPYHALNCSDLLITKFSTMGIEAMIFEKPVISVILDLEERWQIYQDAATYFFDAKKMYEFLEKILHNNSPFSHWKKGQLREQKAFLKSCLNLDIDSYDNEGGLDSSKLAAEAIDKYIRTQDRLCMIS